MYGNNTQKCFFWGICVGGTLGALTTLLFTTKKGKQIQSRVGDLYEDAQGVIKDVFAESKEEIEDTANQISKKITGHKVKEDHAK